LPRISDPVRPVPRPPVRQVDSGGVLRSGRVLRGNEVRVVRRRRPSGRPGEDPGDSELEGDAAPALLPGFAGKPAAGGAVPGGVRADPDGSLDRTVRA